mgnify:CR=1 FL=1|tara:strand:- start:569 stop:772 length:204 start_codon:yes stop_codon:yes gene_type:complete
MDKHITLEAFSKMSREDRKKISAEAIERLKQSWLTNSPPPKNALVRTRLVGEYIVLPVEEKPQEDIK